MSVNITAASNKILIDFHGQYTRRFAGVYTSNYYFSANDLKLTVDGEKFIVPLAELQVSGVNPANVAAALTALDAVFLNAGASASTTEYSRQTYLGDDTWDGTPPSGSSTKTFVGRKIGKEVKLTFDITYATPGGTNTQLILTWPENIPTPAAVNGFTGNSNYTHAAFGSAHATPASVPVTTNRAAIRLNSGGTAYEIFMSFVSTSARSAHITVIFETD